jgi:hypothetical protein
MTEKLHVPAPEPLSLAEYVAALEASVDFGDPRSLLASAGLLARLAAHRTFLGDFLVAGLRGQGAAFQAGNNYDFQSVMLRTTPRYLLRANFWRPMGAETPFNAHERSAFGYGVLHNHNFHLLTVGYLGEGYETDLYHLPDGWRPHRLGERIRMVPIGRERLARGEVLYFRPFEDAHVQIPPAMFSVSLNLMVQAADGEAQQYEIDPASSCVTKVIDSPRNARVHFAELARHLLPDAAERFLQETAVSGASSRVRDLAQAALGSAD